MLVAEVLLLRFAGLLHLGDLSVEYLLGHLDHPAGLGVGYRLCCLLPFLVSDLNRAKLESLQEIVESLEL